MLDRVEPPSAEMVSVRYWAAARDAAGVDSQDMPAGGLDRILAAVLADHPGLAPVVRVCSVFVDGQQVVRAGSRAAAAAEALAGRRDVAAPDAGTAAGGVTGAGAVNGAGGWPQVASGSTVEILPPFAGG